MRFTKKFLALFVSLVLVTASFVAPVSASQLPVGESAGTMGTPADNTLGTDEGTDNGTDEGTGNGTDEGTDEGTDNGTDEGTGDGTDTGLGLDENGNPIEGEPIVETKDVEKPEIIAPTVTFIVEGQEPEEGLASVAGTKPSGELDEDGEPIMIPVFKVEQPLEQPTLPEGMISFDGWYTAPQDEEGGMEWDFDTEITEDLTLWAHFSDAYLIKFYSNPSNVGDGVEVPITADGITPAVDEDLKAAALAEHGAENAYIAFWYFLNEGFEEIDLGKEDSYTEYLPGMSFSEIGRDIDVMPYFGDEFYVFFYSEGTQVELGGHEYVAVANGETVAEPTQAQNPSRAGYIFSHWATKDGETYTLYDFSTPVTGNLTLYAVWTPTTVKYKVVYWVEKPTLDPDALDPETLDPGTDTNNYMYHSTQEGWKAPAGTTVDFSATANVPRGPQGDRNPTLSTLTVNGIKYAEFRHGDKDVTILGNGETIVNVYFKRIVFEYTFNLHPSYISNGAIVDPGDNTRIGITMQFNGETYTQGMDLGSSSGNDKNYPTKLYVLRAK
jgi:uncharacterized repeat protein (TIGR02543 family)